jgi:hypothetical protein
MPEVPVTVRGADLSALHPVRRIEKLDHVFRETRPSGVTVEFILRSKQGLARNNVHIYSPLFIVPVFVLERALRAALLRNPILLGRQLGNSLRILVVVGHNLLLPVRRWRRLHSHTYPIHRSHRLLPQVVWLTTAKESDKHTRIVRRKAVAATLKRDSWNAAAFCRCY